MDAEMNKARLLKLIEEGWEEWDALLSQAGENGTEGQGTESDWSAKDIIAHITWHERAIAEMLREHSIEVGSDLWNLPLDERNAAIYRENRERHREHSLHDVRDEAREAHGQLMAALEPLHEEDLHDPRRYAGMQEDWLPWKIIAENTYEHYKDHVQPMQTLLGHGL